jgi:DNA-binding NarL/FixJ family response regulator
MLGANGQSLAITGAEPWSPLPPRRVVIADRHPLTLEGLAQVLERLALPPVERCRTGAELLAAVDRQPDLVISDVHLPDPDGLQVLRDVRSRGLQVPFIFVAGPMRDAEVFEGVQLGIRGLVAKDAPLDTLEHCVRSVLEGGTCLDEQVVSRATAALHARETALREVARRLTAREMQVLEMVVGGIRTREAADRLCVSEGTLKVHLHHIYQKMQVSSRDALISLARAKGLSY